LTSFNDGLKENNFFGYENKPGPFCDSTSKELEKTWRKATAILSAYLNIFASELKDHWELGNDKGGYLATNEGIRAILKVLKDVLWFIELKDHILIDREPVNVIMPYVEGYIRPLVEFFRSASPEEIQNFRNNQALKGVTKNSKLMMQLINKEFPQFLPFGLSEFLENMDVDGTHDAWHIINDLEGLFHTDVLCTLKGHFGIQNDDWWVRGVPLEIRRKCGDLRENEGRIKRDDQYLHLINYREIVMANWELFEIKFSLAGSGRSKSAKTEWLVKLNEIRNVTHHRSKWPASKEQVRTVREIDAQVRHRFTKDAES